MRKLILALVVAGAAGSVTTVEASTTSIAAIPTNSVAGQSVTFTATFTSSCPGALSTHYFTIDGQGINGALVQSGQAGTETLSTSTLSVGVHDVGYYWKIKGTICQGVTSISYTVAPKPSPSPSPSPSPLPSPSPTPSPVTLAASKASDTPLLGYLGGALIVLVVGAGIALMVLTRR